MNTNKLLTAGAIAFAGYALWYVNRTPGKAIARQPAQQQRDSGLANWLSSWTSLENELRHGASINPMQFAGGLWDFTPGAAGSSTSFMPASGLTLMQPFDFEVNR